MPCPSVLLMARLGVNITGIPDITGITDRSVFGFSLSR
jgi:hypothetical protein